MIGAALNELEARLDEVLAAAHFVDRAYRLRPRLGKAIDWNGPPDTIQLIQAFIVNDEARDAEVISALLIRCVAALERFLRKVTIETIDIRAELATASGQLTVDLKTRNLVNSARLLSTLDQPRDHIAFNSVLMIERLAACEADSKPYILNSNAFSASFQNPTAKSIEKLIDSAGLPNIFEMLGRDQNLQTMFQAKGTRSTREHIEDRLDEIVRNRNNAAHGGDNERTLDITELDSVLTFLRQTCRVINSVLREKFQAAVA